MTIPKISTEELRRIQGRYQTLSVAKARTTVRRVAPASVIKSAQDHVVMCLDLSTAATGWAIGVPGQPAAFSGVLKADKKLPEPAKLLWYTQAIRELVQEHQIGIVVFSEFYNSYGFSFRANCSLRGAVMARLAAVGIDMLPVAEITARKAAGVDVRKRQEQEAKKGYMKARVARRLQELGFTFESDDQADAVVLLLGAESVIRFQGAA